LVNGEEFIGYAPFKGQKVLLGYDEIKDMGLFEGEKSFIKIDNSMFAIIFPEELHMPGIKTVNSKAVKKVVVKIKA
jgi:YhcH/YjgK/YiaL family protein